MAKIVLTPSMTPQYIENGAPLANYHGTGPFDGTPSPTPVGNPLGDGDLGTSVELTRQWHQFWRQSRFYQRFAPIPASSFPTTRQLDLGLVEAIRISINADVLLETLFTYYWTSTNGDNNFSATPLSWASAMAYVGYNHPNGSSGQAYTGTMNTTQLTQSGQVFSGAMLTNTTTPSPVYEITSSNLIRSFIDNMIAYGPLISVDPWISGIFHTFGPEEMTPWGSGAVLQVRELELTIDFDAPGATRIEPGDLNTRQHFFEGRD
jgi:hypothetical protein